MALTTTTLSSAVIVNANSIVVASATGFTPNSLVLIDQEMMQVQQAYISGTTIPVLRGRDGTVTAAHAASANVTVGTAADFASPAPQEMTTYPVAARAVELRSYSAAGAIALPTPGNDMRVIINGTSALAMTLAVPTKDMDGSILTITANGKAAHTVTATGGFGANTTNSDVMTFHATQVTAFECIACNGVWNLIGYVAGAATVAGPGLA